MTAGIGRLLVVVLALLAYAETSEARDSIRWYTDLKQASAAAQKADLPMFIDFWADWCSVCRIMDNEVYTDVNVIGAFEEKAIGVRLHFDLQQDVARKYNVPALPYLLFTNSHGTPLAYHRGLLEAEDLANILRAMPPLARINHLDRALQKDKNDLASVLAMARELRSAGFYESSSAFYARATKHRGLRSDAATRESILYDVALNSLDLQDGKRAADTLEKYLKDFPNNARTPDVLLALGRAYILDDNRERARLSLTALLSRYPQSEAAAHATALLGSL